MPAQTAPPLVVTPDQLRALERMARSDSLPERQVIEARALVRAAGGMANILIAGELGVSPGRVRRWRTRFECRGVGGVGTIAPGRGPKRQVPDGTVAEIVRVTREERPRDGATHWTTRTLAKEMGVHRELVRRVWKDHGLTPVKTPVK